MLNVATNGRTLCGRYTLLERLGAGGQAEVWRAHDTIRGVDVAVKILSPALSRSEAAWQSLEREHAATARLDHPAILKVHPPERDGDVAVLPMELAAGGDLRRLRGASYLDVVPVLIEIAQALEHAHERGVIHRDLKPGNVLLDARGRVRIADFGAAGETSLGAAHDGGRGPLSPFSASPEQLRGEPPTVSDDIYGLGALAYELLSGYPPHYPRFDLKRVLEEPAPELKPAHQVPQQLAALVMRMLAKRAVQRPQSMRDVIDDLDAALNDTLAFDFEPVTAPAAPAAPPPPPPAPVRSAPEHPAVETPRVERSPSSSPPPPPAPAPVRAGPTKAKPTRPEPARPEPVIAPEPPSVRATPQAAEPPAERLEAPRHWDDIRVERVPDLMRVEPVRPRRWPWLVLAVLVLAAVGVFFWLPRFAPPDLALGLPIGEPSAAPQTEQGDATAPVAPPVPANDPPAAAAGTPGTRGGAAESDTQAAEERVREARETFERRLAALEKRGAGQWGGRDFATARSRSAEAVGAYDAGNPRLAAERLAQALQLLDAVEAEGSRALVAQITAGERALEAGDVSAARQAFEAAQRIDARSTRAAQGLRRAAALEEVLPLLAEGANAEAEKEYSRAAQSYSRALALDPANAKAKEGLARANAAFGDDSYATAVGAGFAALGAGRLEDAQAAFDRARRVRPAGAEAADGLARVGAALRARGFASARQRGAALEAEERWREAQQAYDRALQVDPSLAFAQEGRARSAERAELAERLQALIERPERLATPAVRDEAIELIVRARAQEPFGPVLRSQVARLEILLPEFDKPVRLALVSDNATQVAIQRVGSFGTFSRREIELKPGKYTVVGTRVGYRDVRRDVTIAPGQDVQTISVTCVEPI